MLTPKELGVLEYRIYKRLEHLIDEEEYQKIGGKLVPLIVAALQEYDKLRKS